MSQFDLRITQALPSFYDAKTELYLDLLNVGNLLNKDWGRIDDTSGGLVGVAEFVGTEQMPNAVPGTQRYVYRFTTPPSEYVRQDTKRQSRWAAQFGFKVTL